MIREVDVDFINAAIFDDRRDRGDRLFEALGVFAICREIGRQQKSVRCQTGGFHEAHARKNTQGARFVSGGRCDTAADIITQSSKGSVAVAALFWCWHIASADDYGMPA